MFAAALAECGVNESSIFGISENGEFWQEWRFGKNGLVGKGLTAIFSKDGARDVSSVEDIINAPGSFVEIGNLIHVYGISEGEVVIPTPRDGYDVGMGIGRLAMILEGKTLYELDPLRGLVGLVNQHLVSLASKDPDLGLLRVLTDHLRSITALIQEGLKPGNKQHAFVLRKLIRSFLELVWLVVGRIVPTTELVRAFVENDAPDVTLVVMGVVSEEEKVFRETLERGRLVLAKNPLLDPEVLKGTYGIRQSLLPLLLGS